MKRFIYQRASVHILFLMLIALLFSLPGCASFKEWRYLPATKEDEKSIHVVRHGWHTGVVLSWQDLGCEFSFLDEYLPTSPYYEFGWGEADFYQAEKATISMALKALFWKNPSVMHVVAVPIKPGEYFNQQEVLELNLSQTGLDHLRNALRTSFKFDENNSPYSLKKGQYGESRFFKAEGYFFIANTCNSWTATMLESAGVPMNSITLRADSVICQAKNAKQRYVCCKDYGGQVYIPP